MVFINLFYNLIEYLREDKRMMIYKKLQEHNLSKNQTWPLA